MTDDISSVACDLILDIKLPQEGFKDEADLFKEQRNQLAFKLARVKQLVKCRMEEAEKVCDDEGYGSLSEILEAINK